jgi:hypothetical protein
MDDPLAVRRGQRVGGLDRSMATAQGCAGMSSGTMSTGVWHWRTKWRVT